MFQNIIIAFLSAFLGLVFGYFTAMRSATRIEALLTTLTPYLDFISKRRILRRWHTFAYGDDPEHYDIQDTTHEYFSGDWADVKIRRKKVFDRIHKILQVKI